MYVESTHQYIDFYRGIGKEDGFCSVEGSAIGSLGTKGVLRTKSLRHHGVWIRKEFSFKKSNYTKVIWLQKYGKIFMRVILPFTYDDAKLTWHPCYFCLQFFRGIIFLRLSFFSSCCFNCTIMMLTTATWIVFLCIFPSDGYWITPNVIERSTYLVRRRV